MAPRKDARAAVLATWIARFLTAVAVFCVVTALFPGLRSVLEPVRDLIELTTIGAQPNLAYAAYLGILAAAVRRRKRIAWWFLVLLLIVPNMVYDVAEVVVLHHGLLSLAVLTAVLVILILARPAFDAEVAPRAGWRALATVAVAVVVGFVLGMAALTLFPGRIASAGARAQTALVFLTGGTNVTTNRFDVFRELPSPPPLHGVTVFLGLLGAAVQLAGAWVLFRPRRMTLYQTPDDDRQLRGLLTTYADDSLGYFATRHDKSAIFAPSGAAAVTYRVVAGVSLASGDPVGDPRQWPAAIRAWLAEARRYAWAPAVMGTTEAGAHAYADAGLHVLELGDEAVLRVADYDLAGRRMRGVRQAVQRLERLGYTCRIRRHADIPADELAEIGSDADRWRGTQGERGFSMALGRLGDPRDGRCVLVECLDRHGYRRALLSFAPWGRRGLSLDLMRRSAAAPNGVVELMVSRLVEAARALGVDQISLNFAIFRSGLVEGAEIGAGPVARVWRRTLLLASRWWQIEALYRANAKFEPEWVTRFLCYPRSRDMPRIAVASGVAEGLCPYPSGRAAGCAGAVRAGWRRRCHSGRPLPGPVPSGLPGPSSRRRSRDLPAEVSSPARSRPPTSTSSRLAANAPCPNRNASAGTSCAGCVRKASTPTPSAIPGRPPPPTSPRSSPASHATPGRTGWSVSPAGWSACVRSAGWASPPSVTAPATCRSCSTRGT